MPPAFLSPLPLSLPFAAPHPSSTARPPCLSLSPARRRRAPPPTPPPAPTERLQKVLSRAGVCSRRAAEALIAESRIRVNGSVAAPGVAVSASDVVEVDGKTVRLGGAGDKGGVGGGGKAFWFAAYKSKGILCDKGARKSVVDGVGGKGADEERGRMKVVGRLEGWATGLVVVTNELGCVAGLEKAGFVREFEVTVIGYVGEEVQSLRAGVDVGGKVVTAEVDVVCMGLETNGIGGGSKGKAVKVSVMVWRMREVPTKVFSKVCEKLGWELVGVKSVGFGPVQLGSDMRKGGWRYLTNNEVKALKRGIVKNAGEVEGAVSGDVKSLDKPRSSKSAVRKKL